MQERGDTGRNEAAAKVADQLLRIAAAGIIGMGTDGAELAVPRETHPLAHHGHELAVLTDTEVIPELPGIRLIIAGLDAIDKPVHLLFIFFSKADDVFFLLWQAKEEFRWEQLRTRH